MEIFNFIAICCHFSDSPEDKLTFDFYIKNLEKFYKINNF